MASERTCHAMVRKTRGSSVSLLLHGSPDTSTQDTRRIDVSTLVRISDTVPPVTLQMVAQKISSCRSPDGTLFLLGNQLFVRPGPADCRHSVSMRGTLHGDTELYHTEKDTTFHGRHQPVRFKSTHLTLDSKKGPSLPKQNVSVLSFKLLFQSAQSTLASSSPLLPHCLSRLDHSLLANTTTYFLLVEDALYLRTSR